MIVMDDEWIFDDFDIDDFAIVKYVERRGWLYVLTDKAFPGFVKVGRSANVHKRMLDYNSDKPYGTAKLVALSDRFDDVILVENKILEYLYSEIEPTTFKKEWFDVKHLDLIKYVIEEAEKHFNRKVGVV